MTDMDDQITATERRVGTFTRPEGEAHTVVLTRTYDADIDDVWSACTEADRIARWFLPVSGDLHLGGKYQLEGNAGGEILVCEPPRRLVVSWIYDPDGQGGDDFGEVEVNLSPAEGGGTRFELEHRAVVDPDFWNRFGPGAVGVGWDLGLVGLTAHLAGQDPDREAMEGSPEARDFMRRSAALWGDAHAASGEDPDKAAAVAATTAEFYAPEPGAEPGAEGSNADDAEGERDAKA
jgi:uncharacterized protein YndB with AHSA1/START domain